MLCIVAIKFPLFHEITAAYIQILYCLKPTCSSPIFAIMLSLIHKAAAAGISCNNGRLVFHGNIAALL